ncbi:hypothetical protein [Fodinicola feengrottensis]|uniref:hypothetical protein n=1 Tax=Fodinicola feengrottensis TaxID=435914 RepID=UPI0013D5DF64|nr:hypothetical protein [Fodinicola feengrottensis]
MVRHRRRGWLPAGRLVSSWLLSGWLVRLLGAVVRAVVRTIRCRFGRWLLGSRLRQDRELRGRVEVALVDGLVTSGGIGR